LPGRFVP